MSGALIPMDYDEGWGVEEVVNAFSNRENWEMLAEVAPQILERGMQIAQGNYLGALQGSAKYFKGAYNALRVRGTEEDEVQAAQDRYENSRAAKAQARAKQAEKRVPYYSQRGYRRAGRRRARMRYQYYGYKPPKTPYYYRYL